MKFTLRDELGSPLYEGRISDEWVDPSHNLIIRLDKYKSNLDKYKSNPEIYTPFYYLTLGPEE